MDKQFLAFLDAIPTPIRIVRVVDQGVPVFSAFNKAAIEEDDMSLSDFVGKAANEVYPGPIGETACKNHQVVVETKKPLMFDVQEQMQDGIHALRVSLAPVIDENGLVSYIICSQFDITAEKKLQVSESNAEVRIQEMEQYISMAAHDLRSPMRQVRQLAQFMLEDFEDLGDGKKDLLKMMETVSDKALALITDVLEHAQATAQRETVSEVFDFSDLCAQIFAVLDPLSLNTLDCAPASIVADKISIQIAITNLIDNALKHNGNKSVAISIKLEQYSTDLIRICISDDGIGFPQSTKAYFESNVLKTDSGFGIAGVARMIRARGGDIEPPLDNLSGGGTISFTLPGIIVAESGSR